MLARRVKPTLQGVGFAVTLLAIYIFPVCQAQSQVELFSQVPNLVIEDPCGVDPNFPSYSDDVYGSEAIIPDGDLEDIDPFIGRLTTQLYLDPFVLSYVCSTSSPSTVAQSAQSFVNETVLNQECETAINELGNLPGSSQFALSFSTESGNFGNQILSLIIQTAVPDPVRPFLQFWVQGYPGTAVDISVSANFGDPNLTASSDVAVARLELADFAVDFNGSYSCPTSNNWRRFRVSMEPLLDIFQNTAFTSRFLTDFSIRFENAIVVVDNVELVGPRLANDSLYSDRFVSLSQVEIPELRSYLGSDTLDTVFFVLPITSLIVCIILVIMQCFSERNQAARAFVAVWAALGVSIAAYAVWDYNGFLTALVEIEAETLEVIAEYEVVREQINPREIRRKIQGDVPFGFTRIALPKLNKSSLEKLFVFPPFGAPTGCQPRFGSPCANTTEEFFAHLDAQENATLSNLRLEANAELSQEHFLPVLLASLIFDIATSSVQVIALLIIAVCRALSAEDNASRRRSVWFLKYTARFLTLIGIFLTISLIGFVIFDPIRYNVEYELLESTESIRIPVTVRSGLEILDSFSGKLFIDSSSLGIVTRFVNSADAVGQQPLALSFAEQRDEIYSFYRAETEDETCDWDGYTQDFDELKYTLDCSNGIIPVVSESSVKPFVDFAYDRIIFNLVVIDIAITLVDILIVKFEEVAYDTPDEDEETKVVSAEEVKEDEEDVKEGIKVEAEV